MTVPVLRPQTMLAIGNSLPVDEPYGFLEESVRAIPAQRDLSGLRGTRSRLASQLVSGTYAVSGQLLLEPNLDEFARLLPRILGGSSTTDESSGDTSCTLGETIPDFFLTIDRGPLVFTYSGCKIVQAILTASAGKPLELALSIEGLAESVDDAGSFPPLGYVAVPLLRFAGASIELAGSAREVKEIAVVVENSAKLDRYINSITRIDLPIIDRAIRLHCTLDFEMDNADIYQARNVPAHASVQFAAGNRMLTFEFNNVRCEIDSPSVGGATAVVLAPAGLSAASAAGGELLVVYTN